MRLKQPKDCFALSFLSVVDTNYAKVSDMWPNYLKMLEEIWLYLAIYCLPKGWVYQSNHYLISYIGLSVFVLFSSVCLLLRETREDSATACILHFSDSFGQQSSLL